MSAAVLLSLGVSAILIAIAGKSPTAAMSALLEGAVGSKAALSNTANKTAALLLVALGVIVAWRAKLLNVGGEGQIYTGALAGLLVADLVALPGLLHVLVAMVGAAVGGALLGLLAGVLKVKRNVNEVISTLLLNFVAISFVSYLVHGPLMESSEAFQRLPQSAPVAESARLPRPFSGMTLHAGLLVALALVFLVSWMLRRTTFGMTLKVVGANPDAARHAGLPAGRVALAAMAIAGGFAGLAGGSMLLGEQFRLQDGFSPGFGFDGIVVALLAQGSPVGAVLASVLFGGLRAGGGLMQAKVGVPASLVLVTQGLVVLFVAASNWLSERRSARGS
ncbi:MAG: ABC transporter permease [Acidimicrobiia bacterium]|nr:ABC transporter permease [Acidimicrobiia bacterium]